MSIKGSLLAWIEPCDRGKFAGCYIGEGALRAGQAAMQGRAPAVLVCATRDQAEEWIVSEADSLDLPVKWVNERPT